MPGNFICGICQKGSVSEKGLRVHANREHQGQPRSTWQPGWVPKERARKDRHNGVLIESPTTGELVPVSVALAHRQYKQIERENNRPKTIADEFTALPWPVIPSTGEVCDEVAKALGKAANGLDPRGEVYAVIMSQRDYHLALGARKRRQKAVA